MMDTGMILMISATGSLSQMPWKSPLVLLQIDLDFWFYFLQLEPLSIHRQKVIELQLHEENARCNLSAVSNFSNLNYLTMLRLEKNELYGPLPDWIGDMVLLTDLRLDDNAFTGELPRSWRSLSLLQKLFLQKNYLTGTVFILIGFYLILSYVFQIPNSWFKYTEQNQSLTGMEGIKQFKVQQNFLSGALPVAMEHLAGFQFFFFFLWFEWIYSFKCLCRCNFYRFWRE